MPYQSCRIRRQFQTFSAGSVAVVTVFEQPAVLDWVRQAHERSQWTVSVCTGSMVLGKAGLLNGLRATTYWSGRQYLESLGATYVAER